MIRLRKLEPEDLPFLYRWENDATAWADADNHNPLSQQDLRSYIESTTGDIYRDGQLRLIVEDVAGDESVVTFGCIDLFDLDIRNRRAAIGMYIASEARSKGVGKEAVRLLEQYAFNHLNLRLVYAVISVRNDACTALYRSLDYLPTARLRDWTLEGDAIVWQKTKK
ncbi:MAG: GNAT family N-acetyltransferase [Paludibacteraceae bacterium]